MPEVESVEDNGVVEESSLSQERWNGPKEVKLILENGVDYNITQGLTHGVFAVHHTPSSEGPKETYSLTHLPTGYDIVRNWTEEDCKKMGEFLWDKLFQTFKLVVPEALLARLEERSPEILLWIYESKEEGHWKEPPE